MGRTHNGELQGELSPVGGTPQGSRGSRDSPEACGADHGEAAVSPEPRKDEDEEYTNGGLQQEFLIVSQAGNKGRSSFQC